MSSSGVVTSARAGAGPRPPQTPLVDQQPERVVGIRAVLAAGDGEDVSCHASVGFQVLEGGETWESHNRRRVSRAILRELSLVADPAYADTRVVDVGALAGAR